MNQPDDNDGRTDGDSDLDIDATAEDQLAELRGLGVADNDLLGLTFADAEEWIDELRTQRRDAGRLGRSSRPGP